MKNLSLALLCAAGVAVCALFNAGAQEDAVATKLRLVDAVSKQPRGGMVRLRDAEGKVVRLPGLLPRLLGVKVADEFDGWHVVPAAGANVTLPRGAYRGEAVSGLETLASTFDLDSRKSAAAETLVTLPPCFDPQKQGLVAGNTHLHLMKITKEQAEQYLKLLPAADGLKVMFISYLERFKDDAEYITNRYPVGDLREFDTTGVLFNNGEEHRHNIGGYGEGYGHVMFLNIKELVKPVSLGPGITGAGFDDRPLRPGIDEAKRQGGTIIWCHNTNGREDVLSAITGRLDALNVFDGSRGGKFEDTYYRFLNFGLRLPISTGTDWFIYDFARVYAQVDGELSIPRWLDALKAGRNVITNGPLLSLKVDGKEPGATVLLDKPGKVVVEVNAVGRHYFHELQLVHNGKVIQRRLTSKVQGGPVTASLREEVRLEESGWLAARVESSTKNELGHVLFAHTSPVYVEVAGKSMFDVESAHALLKMVEDGQAASGQQGTFSSPEARAKLLTLYDEAATLLRKRINERK